MVQNNRVPKERSEAGVVVFAELRQGGACLAAMGVEEVLEDGIFDLGGEAVCAGRERG
jgi:hypothetical protein